MGYSKSDFAFEDIRAAFDRALGASKGIRIRCTSRGAAIVLRSRFNYFRKVDRQSNSRIYDRDHPMHGASSYDVLVLRIPPKGSAGESTIYIEKRVAEDLDIEEIT